MNTRLFFCILLCFIATGTKAAILTGHVFDSKGQPLSGVSVALLYPSDSTLATFAISNKEGAFTINDATEAHYLLQAALPGYYTEYERIDFVQGEQRKEAPAILLQKNADDQKLKEVVISGERVPISIKGDTVEYNASSYRVKPNAPVEDLLRQLPGVQVDERGNIKSMGKEVRKVLVDGKEFFGTDPKIATKNLPADAIDKVQTFGKHSDQSEFTGIDDGTRDQTINLQLKAGKKKGYFGEIKAGAGTAERFDAGAKIFRFRAKEQIALLATANNINQFGFSFEDFINFNGGLGNLMNGGSLDNIDDMPVDFGRPVTGRNTSGAVGLNYSTELKPQNRFTVSYIGSGLGKTQGNDTRVRNYLPSGAEYVTNERASVEDNNTNQGINMKWNNRADSANQLLFSLNGQLKNSFGNTRINSSAAIGTDTLNRFSAFNQDNGNTGKINSTFSWAHKINNPVWKNIQAGGNIEYRQDNASYDWDNATSDLRGNIVSHQFQDNLTRNFQSGIDFSATRKIGEQVYLEPKLSGTYGDALLNRSQGNIQNVKETVDSLSPELRNTICTFTPGLGLRSGTKKRQWSAGLEGKCVWMNPVMKGLPAAPGDFYYLLPYFFWRRETGDNESLECSYTTHLQTPRPNELLPVLYYSSPLSGIKGDVSLKPEYHHDVHFSYRHFNRFEMSSFFAGLNGSYIHDKIGTAIQVLPNLGQQAQWVNTAYAAHVGFDASYSRPVKPLAIELGFELNEQVQLSESPVNSVSNKTTALVHHFGMSVSNRKKRDRWNARLGADIQVSDSRYSISREFNNVFYNYTGSAYLNWQPNKRCLLAMDGRLKYYAAQSFDQPVSIPLLGAELTYYFGALQRASLTLKGFDLLNKNRSVIRQGLRNSLVEQNANVLQRYGMLTFTYKLTKVSGNN